MARILEWVYPVPSPADLREPGIKPGSPALQADTLLTELSEKKRKAIPTPVFWHGEFHGLYSPWGGKESDTTKRLSLSLFTFM